MTPALLASLVGIASFFALSTMLALAVSAWWRFARQVRLDASRLLALRLLPACGGLLLTLCLVAPAFARFEPARDNEQAGPMLLALSAAGAIVLLTAVTRVLRAVFLTHRLRRRWLATATALPALDDRTPAHLIDVPYPLVAIIGILRPVLVVSREVAVGCSADDVRLIAAHERAHLRARDNLKRLLIDGCPDVLRWTSTGREIAAAWAAEVEDAADDAATGGDHRARIALAGVLLRVARMAASSSPAPGLASALVGISGVERRVRRLAGPGEAQPVSCASLYLAAGAAAAALASAAASHQLLAITYIAAEIVVGLGR